MGRCDAAPTWDVQREMARQARRRVAELGARVDSTQLLRGARNGRWLDGRGDSVPRGTRSGRWLDGVSSSAPTWEALLDGVSSSAPTWEA
jgi:hypothetical protein